MRGLWNSSRLIFGLIPSALLTDEAAVPVGSEAVFALHSAHEVRAWVRVTLAQLTTCTGTAEDMRVSDYEVTVQSRGTTRLVQRH